MKSVTSSYPNVAKQFADQAPAKGLRRHFFGKDTKSGPREARARFNKLQKAQAAAVTDAQKSFLQLSSSSALPLQLQQEDLASQTVRSMIENQKNADPRDLKIATIADALFSKGVGHESSFSNIGYVPLGNPAIPELAFIGRAKCGMTSLLRSLFKSHTAVAKASGRLRRDVINCYSVGSGSGGNGGGFHVLETPSFGAKTVPWMVVLQHCSLIRNLCAARPNLKMIYYVMDVSDTQGLSYRDMDTLKFMKEEIKNFTIVMTKVDRNTDMNSIYEQLRYHNIEHPAIATSAFTLGGIDTLRFDMVNNVLHSIPTEKLSMNEVRRLSERMYSAGQIESGAVGPKMRIHRPVSVIDEEHARWRAKLLIEREHEDQQLQIGEGKSSEKKEAKTEDQEEVDDSKNTNEQSPDALVVNENQISTETVGDLLHNSLQHNMAVSSRLPSEKSAQKFLRPLTPEYLKYIAKTSPWRNPYLYPKNVALTFNKRVNVVKCPEDPDNPFLEQAKFVSPRADWNFRSPSLKFNKRFNIGRGRYLPNPPEYYSNQFSIPFFPEIVDVRLNPSPVAFVGQDAYSDGGRSARMLALKQQEAATVPLIDITKKEVAEQPSVVARLGSGGAKSLGAALKRLDEQRLEIEMKKKNLLLEDQKKKQQQKVLLPNADEEEDSNTAKKDDDGDHLSEEEKKRKEMMAKFSHPSF